MLEVIYHSIPTPNTVCWAKPPWSCNRLIDGTQLSEVPDWSPVRICRSLLGLVLVHWSCLCVACFFPLTHQCYWVDAPFLHLQNSSLTKCHSSVSLLLFLVYLNSLQLSFQIILCDRGLVFVFLMSLLLVFLTSFDTFSDFGLVIQICLPDCPCVPDVL